VGRLVAKRVTRLSDKITLMGLHGEAVPSKLKRQHHNSDCGDPARNGAAGGAGLVLGDLVIDALDFLTDSPFILFGAYGFANKCLILSVVEADRDDQKGKIGCNSSTWWWTCCLIAQCTIECTIDDRTSAQSSSKNGASKQYQRSLASHDPVYDRVYDRSDRKI
jgi:hypothetical protein